MSVHAEPAPLQGSLPGGRADATVSVEPLNGGDVQQPRAWFESTGGRLALLRGLGVGTPRSKWWWVPCPAFLIRHPSAGPVLVDTSLHSSVAASAVENMGRLATRVARPRVEPGRDLLSQLRERGVDPKSIPTVVMTHMHLDHTSGISEFPDATFIVTAQEWEAATTDRRPLLRGYRPEHFDYVFDYRTLDYNGEGISSYATFGRTFDLFGDGSVRLAFSPGHSAGHQSLICRLRDRDLVIAGDSIYTWAQLDGGPPPVRPLDPHTWRRSLRELQHFKSRYPQAVIVPGHDPELFTKLEARYE